MQPTVKQDAGVEDGVDATMEVMTNVIQDMPIHLPTLIPSYSDTVKNNAQQIDLEASMSEVSEESDSLADHVPKGPTYSTRVISNSNLQNAIPIASGQGGRSEQSYNNYNTGHGGGNSGHASGHGGGNGLCSSHCGNNGQVSRCSGNNRQNTGQGRNGGKNPSAIKVDRGTAPGLVAARRNKSRDYPSSTPNRTCTRIFVTNLHPKTNSQQMEVYIRRETGQNIVAENLQTRYSSSSSFYICCEQPTRNALMDLFLWPAESKVKFYYS